MITRPPRAHRAHRAANRGERARSTNDRSRRLCNRNVVSPSLLLRGSHEQRPAGREVSDRTERHLTLREPVGDGFDFVVPYRSLGLRWRRTSRRVRSRAVAEEAQEPPGHLAERSRYEAKRDDAPTRPLARVERDHPVSFSRRRPGRARRTRPRRRHDPRERRKVSRHARPKFRLPGRRRLSGR